MMYTTPPINIIGNSSIIILNPRPSKINGRNKMPPIIKNGSKNNPPTNLNTKPKRPNISLKANANIKAPAIKVKIVVSIFSSYLK